MDLRLVMRNRLDSSRFTKILTIWAGSLKYISSPVSSSNKNYMIWGLILRLELDMIFLFFFFRYYFTLFCYSEGYGLKLSKKSLYVFKLSKVYNLEVFLPVKSAFVSSFSLIIATLSFLSLVMFSAFFIVALVSCLFSFKWLLKTFVSSSSICLAFSRPFL